MGVKQLLLEEEVPCRILIQSCVSEFSHFEILTVPLLIIAFVIQPSACHHSLVITFFLVQLA